MCNRFVQSGQVVKPGQRAIVRMRGPGGEWDMEFDGAVFGGPARNESRNYWIRREGAEEVLVPNVESFGEKDKASGEQRWEPLPAPMALEGLLLPQPPGKDYRLLKVVTQESTPDHSPASATTARRCCGFCDREGWLTAILQKSRTRGSASLPSRGGTCFRMSHFRQSSLATLPRAGSRNRRAEVPLQVAD